MTTTGEVNGELVEYETVFEITKRKLRKHKDLFIGIAAGGAAVTVLLMIETSKTLKSHRDAIEQLADRSNELTRDLDNLASDYYNEMTLIYHGSKDHHERLQKINAQLEELKAGG